MEKKFTWLDSILSVPTVGVAMDPWFEHPKSVWELVNLLYIDLIAEGKTVELETTIPKVTLKVSDGIYIHLDINSVVVSFTYQLEMKKKAGELSYWKCPDKILSYSELMDRVVKQIKKVFHMKNWDNTRKITRIGVVAESQLAITELPPGVEKLRSILESSWGANSLRSSNAELVADLFKEDGKFRKQCIHRIVFDKDKEDSGLGFVMDWQNYYYEKVGCSFVEKELDANISEAMIYFEDFGSGIHFSEQ